MRYLKVPSRGRMLPPNPDGPALGRRKPNTTSTPIALSRTRYAARSLLREFLGCRLCIAGGTFGGGSRPLSGFDHGSASLSGGIFGRGLSVYRRLAGSLIGYRGRRRDRCASMIRRCGRMVASGFHLLFSLG